MDFSYIVTYSVMTTKHDEKRYRVTVPAARLSVRIRVLQARPNTYIYAVERVA